MSTAKEDPRRIAAKDLYVKELKSIAEIAVELGIPEPTLYNWHSRSKWRDERDKLQIMSKKLSDSLNYLLDPQTSEEAIAEGNLKILLEIQGIHLANLKYAMLTGDHTLMTALPRSIADGIQKYAGAIEKIVNARTKLKNGGVDERKITHVHQIDMDQALQLALEAKRKGNPITVQEAIALIEAQTQNVNKPK